MKKSKESQKAIKKVILDLTQLESNPESLIKLGSSLLIKCYCKSFLIEKKQICIDETFNIEIMKDKYKIKVVDVLIDQDQDAELTGLSKLYLVDQATEVEFLSNVSSISNRVAGEFRDSLIKSLGSKIVKFSDEEISKLKTNYVKTQAMDEIVNAIKLGLLPNDKLLNKDLVNNFKFKGAVVSGESGSGKSIAIKLAFIECTQNDDKLVILKVNDETDEEIKNTYKYAKLIKHCVVLFPASLSDNLIVAIKDDTGKSSNSNNKILNQVIEEIDLLKIEDEIFTIVETNLAIEDVDSRIKAGGRLDLQISLIAPDSVLREKYVTSYLKSVNHELSQNQIEKITEKLQGFMPGDIISVLK